MRQAFEDVIEFMRAAGQAIRPMPQITKSISAFSENLWSAVEDLGWHAQIAKDNAKELRDAGDSKAPTYLGAGLLLEELAETIQAMQKGDIDGLADLVYVTVWTAAAHGIDLPAVWTEVQKSNMAKFPGGKAVMDEAGKAVKPDGWTPPDIAGVLKRQGSICE